MFFPLSQNTSKKKTSNRELFGVNTTVLICESLIDELSRGKPLQTRYLNMNKEDYKNHNWEVNKKIESRESCSESISTYLWRFRKAFTYHVRYKVAYVTGKL